jgi:WD40 repeat protein
VFALTFAPDGQSLISGGSEGCNPLLWDLATGNSVSFPAERQGWINAMSLSPDGKVLATASTDSTVLLWDLPQRRLQSRLIARGAGSVNAATFSTDGRRLLAGYGDSTVRLWDMDAREERAMYRGHHAGVVAVAFSPDGRSLLSSSWDRTVKVWDPESRSHEEVIAHDKTIISNFSPDGRRLAWTDSEGRLKVWDVAGRVPVSYLSTNSTYHQFPRFSPNGEILAQMLDERVKLWDARALELRGELTNGFDAYSLSFSPDSRILAIAGLAMFHLHGITNRLTFWDLASQQRINRLAVAAPSAVTVSFSHDGRMVAIGYLNGEVRIWDYETERLIVEFTDQRQRIWAVAFSPDDGWLAAGGEDGGLCSTTWGRGMHFARSPRPRPGYSASASRRMARPSPPRKGTEPSSCGTWRIARWRLPSKDISAGQG